MGILSDLFSGKKHKEALDHLKNKAALLTVAGATLFVTAGASRSGGYSDVREPVKKEAVQNKDSIQAQTDAVVAKFDDYRLKHAAERMMKTPTGAAVLKGLTQKAIPVEVTSEISPDLGGAYYPDMKKILINPECSDDLIASILVHEGSHALQAANGCRLGPHLNAQSYFTMNKAMEADAMKNQLFAAAELKSAGDASVYDAFAREHGKLVKSYEGFCKQFGEQRDSVAKHTMLAYYNNRAYIKTYENRYVDALNAFFKAGKKKENGTVGLFHFDYPAAEIINRVCRLDGKCYMAAADTVFLQDSARNYVSKSTYNSLEKLSKKHAETLPPSSALAKPDTSYQKFYVVDLNGKVLRAPEKSVPSEQKHSAVSTTAVAGMIKNGGR